MNNNNIRINVKYSSENRFFFITNAINFLQTFPFSHVAGTGHLQVNPPVAGPWITPGKPTGRAVTTLGSNE